ncbi:MAG TPA: hypothetical protein VI248_03050 [Kineosporiaceae bacterium]
MTQTTGRPVAPVRSAAPVTRPAPGASPPGPATTTIGRQARPGRIQGLARTLFQGSPGRLRLAGMLAIAVCLVFGALSAAAFQARSTALANADADAAQLIRVQQITTEVVRADSLLTATFPSPEKETAEQVDAFNQALKNAAQLVAQAAAANPADGDHLAAVSDALGQYRQYATSARIYNKLHDQSALGYLRQAGTALRGGGGGNPNLITGNGMLPALNKLIAANSQRVKDAYAASGWATWEMIGADLVALAGLGWVQVWLARRTRRYLNLPLVAASAGVLAVGLAGLVVMTAAQSRATTVRDTSYTAFTALADARIAANTAKSDASISFLYLRTGGSALSYETEFMTAAALVQQRVDTAGSAVGTTNVGHDFSTWRGEAEKVFQTSTENWPTVAAAMADPAQPFNVSFQAVDDSLRRGIEQQARAVDVGLGTGDLTLRVLAWLAVGVGLVSAVLAWAGIAQRLEDYR